MDNNRRDFFKTVGAVTAGVMMAAPRAAEAAVAADKYVSAYRHALSIEGLALEEILSVDGGEIRGIVVNETPVNNVVKKHLSNIAYEDISISLGASLPPGVYAWIQATLNAAPQSKSGVIVAADGQGNPRSQLRFSGGLITEVAFPALDSLHRAPAELAVTFAPGSLVINEPPTSTAKIGGTKQKAWLASNFRLQLTGLEEACARVTKIESFTVKQTFTPPRQGSSEPPTANALEVSDLVIYCPEEFADQLRAWAHDFLINGNRSNEFEKAGTLEFLAPDLKTVYFTLTLGGLGIFGCGLEGEEMKTSINRRVKAELYCETVNLTVGAVG